MYYSNFAIYVFGILGNRRKLYTQISTNHALRGYRGVDVL